MKKDVSEGDTKAVGPGGSVVWSSSFRNRCFDVFFGRVKVEHLQGVLKPGRGVFFEDLKLAFWFNHLKPNLRSDLLVFLRRKMEIPRLGIVVAHHQAPASYCKELDLWPFSIDSFSNLCFLVKWGEEHDCLFVCIATRDWKGPTMQFCFWEKTSFTWEQNRFNHLSYIQIRFILNTIWDSVILPVCQAGNDRPLMCHSTWRGGPLNSHKEWSDRNQWRGRTKWTSAIHKRWESVILLRSLLIRSFKTLRGVTLDSHDALAIVDCWGGWFISSLGWRLTLKPRSVSVSVSFFNATYFVSSAWRNLHLFQNIYASNLVKPLSREQTHQTQFVGLPAFRKRLGHHHLFCRKKNYIPFNYWLWLGREATQNMSTCLDETPQSVLFQTSFRKPKRAERFFGMKWNSTARVYEYMPSNPYSLGVWGKFCGMYLPFFFIWHHLICPFRFGFT